MKSSSPGSIKEACDTSQADSGIIAFAHRWVILTDTGTVVKGTGSRISNSVRDDIGLDGWKDEGWRKAPKVERCTRSKAIGRGG